MAESGQRFVRLSMRMLVPVTAVFVCFGFASLNKKVEKDDLLSKYLYTQK